MSVENYAVLRFQKLKQDDQTKAVKRGQFKSSKTGIRRALRHNFRIDDLEHVNSKIKNVAVVGGEDIDVILNNIDTYINENVKTVKRDNVVAFELIMTFSKAADIDIDKWTEKNQMYLEKKYGKENLHSLILHLDETTPHLHAIVTPVIEGKLNAKHYTKTIVDLRNMQSEYAEEMAEFGLNRGIEKNILNTNKRQKEKNTKLAKILKKAEKTLNEDLLKKRFGKTLDGFNFVLSPEFINKIKDEKTFTRESARKNKIKIIEAVKKEYERQLIEFKKKLIKENEKTFKTLSDLKVALDARKEALHVKHLQLQEINDDLNAEVQKQVKLKAEVLQKQIDDFKNVEITKIKSQLEQQAKHEINTLKEEVKRKDVLITEFKKNESFLKSENEQLRDELNLYKSLDKNEIKELRSIKNELILMYVKNNYKESYDLINAEEKHKIENSKLKSFDFVKDLFKCDMNSAILILQKINAEKMILEDELKQENKKNSYSAPKPRF